MVAPDMIVPASLVWIFCAGFVGALGVLSCLAFWRWAQREGVKWAAKEWQGLRW